MNRDEMAEFFRSMFGTDCARIASPSGNLFLILGTRRNTSKDREEEPTVGQWYKNGEPIDFDYIAEETVAHGRNFKELLKSANAYKRQLAAESERVTP